MGQGALRGVQQAGIAAEEGIQELAGMVGIPTAIVESDEGQPGVLGTGYEFMTQQEATEAKKQDVFSLKAGFEATGTDLSAPTTTAGKLTEGVSQFVTSFVGVGKFLPVLKAVKGAGVAGNIAREATRGAAADFIGFKGSEKNLSDFLSENMKLSNPVIDYLSHDPDDSEVEARFKNALEGLGIGAIVEPLTIVVRSISRGVKARKAAKAAGGTDEAADEAAEVAFEAERKALDDVADQMDAFRNTDDVTGQSSPVTLNNREARGITDEFLAGRPTLDVTRATNMVRKWIAHGEELGTYEPSGFNHATHDSAEKVQEGVRQMAVLVRKELDEQVQAGTKSLNAETAQAKEYLADTLDLGADDLIRRTAKVAENANDMAAMLVATKMYVQSLSREVYGLVQKIDDLGAGASDFEKAKLHLLLQQWGDLTGNLKAIQTGTARTVSAGRIRTADLVSGSKINTAALTDIVGRAGFDAKTRDLAKMLNATAGDTKAMNKLLKHHNRGIRVVNEFFINSLLSGPKTHIVNMSSNMVQAFALPTEQLMGGVMSGNGQASMQALRHFWYLTTAMKGGGRAFVKAIKSGDNYIDPNVNTLDLANADRMAIWSERDGLLGTAIRGTGHLTRMPTRLLSAEDEFFKHINYTAAYKSKLHTDALDKFTIPAGSSSAEVAAIVRKRNGWIEDMMEKGFDPDTGRALDQEALEFAREATFTSPLKAGTVGATVNKAVNNHPMARLILPFVRTPTNLIRQFVARTPVLGLAQKELREEIAAGGARRARAIGKQATGGLIIGNIMYGALEGRITGGGPADPKQRANMLRTGWRPYSFVTANDDGTKTYTSYARMDPFASLLGITADLMVIGGQLENEDLDEVGTALMIAVARNITQKSYLTGIVDVLGAIDQPDRNMQTFINRFASSFVPTGFKQFGDLVSHDPIMRDTRNILDAMKAKIPGLSTTLPAKYDWVTGEPVPYPQGFLYPDPISPFPRTTRKHNRVFEELARLGHGFSAPIRSVDNVELEPAEYARLTELHGTVKLGGKTLVEALDKMYRSSSYDLERKGPLPDGPEGRRLDRTKQTIARYRARAKFELKRELKETLGQRIRNQRTAERSAKYGRDPRGEPNQDLIDRIEKLTKSKPTF